MGVFNFSFAQWGKNYVFKTGPYGLFKPLRVTLIFKYLKNALLRTLLIVSLFCSSCGVYYLDAPVSDRIMFADNTQNSDLARVEDGGLVGSIGECPTW